MDDDTRADLTVMLSPGSPAMIAWAWMRLIVIDENVDAAWPLTTPSYRTEAAKDWVEANLHHPAFEGHDIDTLVSDLGSLGRSHPLWPAFAETQIRAVWAALPDFDPETWGMGSEPRIVGVNRELILFMRTDDTRLGRQTITTDDGSVIGEVAMAKAGSNVPPRCQLVMEHDETEGWRVAGLDIAE